MKKIILIIIALILLCSAIASMEFIEENDDYKISKVYEGNKEKIHFKVKNPDGVRADVLIKEAVRIQEVDEIAKKD